MVRVFFRFIDRAPSVLTGVKRRFAGGRPLGDATLAPAPSASAASFFFFNFNPFLGPLPPKPGQPFAFSRFLTPGLLAPPALLFNSHDCVRAAELVAPAILQLVANAQVHPWERLHGEGHSSPSGSSTSMFTLLTRDLDVHVVVDLFFIPPVPTSSSRCACRCRRLNDESHACRAVSIERCSRLTSGSR